MDKKKMIGMVFKILDLYENESFENYTNYLIHVSTEMAGYITEDNAVWLNRYVAKIRGLKFLGKQVTHQEVRSTILNITNGIDRNIKEVRPKCQI